MNKYLSGIRLAASMFALALMGVMSAAHADDTEIFFTNTPSKPANIMLILDTSGSMDTLIDSSAIPYDYTQTYSGSCVTDGSLQYFAAVVTGRRGTSVTPPSCTDTTAQFTSAQNKCTASVSGITGSTGYYSGTFIRWGTTTSSASAVLSAPTTSATCTAIGATWVAATTHPTVAAHCQLNSASCTRLGGNTWSATTNTCSIVTVSTSYLWQNSLTATGGTDIECYADRPGTGADRTYPTKNSFATSSATNEYTSVATDSWWAVTGNTGGSYYLYSGNYLNWYYNHQYNTATRLSTVQAAASTLVDSLSSSVNVGLMRYSNNGEGGMVMDPVLPLTDAQKTSVKNDINAFTADGFTPLSETLFEAYRYFSGGLELYGLTSTTPAGLTPSVASSLSAPGIYNSPTQYSCQKNYIIYLTDGAPNRDSSADTLIKALPNFSTLGGSCYASAAAMNTALGGAVTGSDGTGLCLEALSQYLYKSDLRPLLGGTQNVTSYYIGFGTDFTDTGGAGTSAFQLLTNAATRGGGQSYSATDYDSLTAVFNSIAGNIALDTNTLFSAPTVAVNAFNRTQTLDDLYVSVFQPKTTYRWPGNLKKYKVVNENVVDETGAQAVDPATGFFKSTAQSYWSASVDGAIVTAGGAANKLPVPANRSLYTYVGSNAPSSPQDLVLLTDEVTAANASSLLNLTTGDPTYANIVAWANGTDVLGENPPSDTSGVRHAIGDPVHSEPAALIYNRGISGSTGYDTVVFMTTNDGYLHAINATASNTGADITSSTVGQSSGEELWSFIPQELLPDLKNLYNNPTVTTKHYGLDGPVRLLKFDKNGDGTIDPTAGDQVLLYFSTGRNTSVARYYAMDVTDKNNPQFLWSLSAADLPGLGQTWSPPTTARVTVGDGTGQNGQHLVLIFGGGYAAEEDSYSYVPADGSGNHVYMVDAKSGHLLWDAGPSGSYNLVVPRMTHAIPSSVSVLDIDNDGFADRMYVGDMAGQVWRFDITNGNPANTLVAGGVLASLGDKENLVHTTTTNVRRFYAEPDVALIQPVGQHSFLNIAIGSGYRGHPLDTNVQDRLYSIRDYGYNTSGPFVPMTQAQFNITTRHIIVDGDSQLIDATTNDTAGGGVGTATPVPDLSYGWKLPLNLHGGWVGEKVLTSARTLSNVVYFVSYTPGGTGTAADCTASPPTGTNRVYSVSAFNGFAVKDYNADGSVTSSDRSKDSAQGGIAPGVSLLFPADHSKDVVVMSGPEVIGICTTCRAISKTYWRENSAD